MNEPGSPHHPQHDDMTMVVVKVCVRGGSESAAFPLIPSKTLLTLYRHAAVCNRFQQSHMTNHHPSRRDEPAVLYKFA